MSKMRFMTDDPKKEPNPIEDVRKGLGLLFRAARTAVQKLPTDRLEETVVGAAKEVGRAVESVAQTIEKEVRKVGSAARSAAAAPPATAATEEAPAQASTESPKAADDAPAEDAREPPPGDP